MARIPLIEDKEGLDEDHAAVFDEIVASRGKLLRPFQVLLQTPAIAQRVAELGAVIRFDSQMSDADRELVILATASAHGCSFEWDQHLPIALAAGVRGEAVDALGSGKGEFDRREAILVEFVLQLCQASEVSDDAFAPAHELLGTEGVVELAAIVGYYTMLGYVMSACEAC
jgi:4-carboxymuconolactone decarboxylase